MKYPRKRYLVAITNQGILIRREQFDTEAEADAYANRSDWPTYYRAVVTDMHEFNRSQAK